MSTLARLDELPGNLAGHGVITADWARSLAAAARSVTLLALDPETGAALGIGARTYRPRRALRDRVLALQERCSWPGCVQQAWRCDLDHRRPFDHAQPGRGGRTDAENLDPQCRWHHLLKTHTSGRCTGRPTARWWSPAPPVSNTFTHRSSSPCPASGPTVVTHDLIKRGAITHSPNTRDPNMHEPNTHEPNSATPRRWQATQWGQRTRERNPPHLDRWCGAGSKDCPTGASTIQPRSDRPVDAKWSAKLNDPEAGRRPTRPVAARPALVGTDGADQLRPNAHSSPGPCSHERLRSRSLISARSARIFCLRDQSRIRCG